MKKTVCGLFIVIALIGINITVFENYNYANASLLTNGNRIEIKASHILVRTKEEALRIKKEIESGEISFEDAAMKYSLCPSSINGGNVGYFGRHRMVLEFEEAAFSLPVGHISAPVKTQFGYHLIIVKDVR